MLYMVYVYVERKTHTPATLYKIVQISAYFITPNMNNKIYSPCNREYKIDEHRIKHKYNIMHIKDI